MSLFAAFLKVLSCAQNAQDKIAIGQKAMSEFGDSMPFGMRTILIVFQPSGYDSLHDIGFGDTRRFADHRI